MRSIYFLGVYICVHARSGGGSVGGFPHNCQLEAKGKVSATGVKMELFKLPGLDL